MDIDTRAMSSLCGDGDQIDSEIGSSQTWTVIPATQRVVVAHPAGSGY